MKATIVRLYGNAAHRQRRLKRKKGERFSFSLLQITNLARPITD